MTTTKPPLPGVQYDPEDVEALPTFVRGKPIEVRREWCERENARHAVVATCSFCGRQLRAGEPAEHRKRHIANGRVRSMYASLMYLSVEERLEAMRIAQEMTDAS